MKHAANPREFSVFIFLTTMLIGHLVTVACVFVTLGIASDAYVRLIMSESSVLPVESLHKPGGKGHSSAKAVVQLPDGSRAHLSNPDALPFLDRVRPEDDFLVGQLVEVSAVRGRPGLAMITPEKRTWWGFVGTPFEQTLFCLGLLLTALALFASLLITTQPFAGAKTPSPKTSVVAFALASGIFWWWQPSAQIAHSFRVVGSSIVDLLSGHDATDVRFFKALGGRNCEAESRVTSVRECIRAARYFGMPFALTVNQGTDSHGGAGRPAGCFWDQNGAVYFNQNLEAMTRWSGVGGVCHAADNTPANGAGVSQLPHMPEDAVRANLEYKPNKRPVACSQQSPRAALYNPRY